MREQWLVCNAPRRQNPSYCLRGQQGGEAGGKANITAIACSTTEARPTSTTLFIGSPANHARVGAEQQDDGDQLQQRDHGNTISVSGRGDARDVDLEEQQSGDCEQHQQPFGERARAASGDEIPQHQPAT